MNVHRRIRFVFGLPVWRHVSRDLDTVHECMTAALLLTDRRGRIQRANQASARLLGYEPHELVGMPITALCRTLALPAATAVAAAGPDRPVEAMLRRKDGSTVPVALSVGVLRGNGNKPRGWVCVALDESEHKRAEEELQRSLFEKELLLRELHHRAKNNLQVISGFLDLQSRSVGGSALLEQFTESQNRIRSMALIHEQLYGSDRVDRIDMRFYLQRLTEHLVRCFGCTGDVRLQLQLQDVALSMDQSLTCGFIVNELVSNCLKHAFGPDATGEIRVSLRKVGGTCRLSVMDNGRGLPSEFAPRNPGSLGTRLVNMMVEQLDGRIAIQSDNQGTRVEIAFPLKSATAAIEPRAAS